MDFNITRLFRSLCDDAILIHDVIRIIPQFRPFDKPWRESFTEALALIVENESNDSTSNLKFPGMIQFFCYAKC